MASSLDVPAGEGSSGIILVVVVDVGVVRCSFATSVLLSLLL